MRPFNEYLELAAKLPQDAKTAIYQLFNDNTPLVYYVLYDQPNPLTIFRAMSQGRNRINVGRGYFYERPSKTNELGQVLPKGVYRHTIMYHRKWSRCDVPVTDVTFDVVGLKRKSSKLPSGVLISNVNFVINPNNNNNVH